MIALLTQAGAGVFCLVLMHTTQSVWSAFALPAFFFVFVSLLDLAVGDRGAEPLGAEDDAVFDLSLYVQALVHFLVFIGLIYVATQSTLPIPIVASAVFAFGLICGQCELIAHEFMHRPGRKYALSAQIVLAITGMGHFFAEHLRSHHIIVATPEDCASARLGESMYAFAVRNVLGEITVGMTNERNRLALSGRSLWSPHNVVFQSYALSLAIAGGLVIWLGVFALPWIILHHVAAWTGLAIVTYIQHYGLLREVQPDGRREPAMPIHSWNSNAAVSNMLLINVQLHAYHHDHPMKPFQSLGDDLSAPRLPTGYFGLAVLAFFPPLWFYVMDRKTIAAVSGRRGRINLGQNPSGRVRSLVDSLCVN